MQFSILMSVYHKEIPEFLKQSIDSILNQTINPSEIVIVKDGKLTKELDNIIDMYISRFPKLIKIVKLDKNYGLGIALNKGLKECKYDIIARMDTDDISLPTRFEKQLNIIGRCDVDIVGCNTLEYDITMNDVIACRKVPETDEEIKKSIKYKNPFNHMTVMYKKDKIIEAGNYENYPYFEDYYLWCKVLKRGGKFYNIQENLVNVRAGEEMTTKRGGIKYIKCILYFQKKIFKLGIINIFIFIISCFIRTIIAIIPNRLRFNFYNRYLRKST